MTLSSLLTRASVRRAYTSAAALSKAVESTAPVAWHLFCDAGGIDSDGAPTMSLGQVAGRLGAAVMFGTLMFAGAARADVIKNYDFSGTLGIAIGGSTSVTGTFAIDFSTSSITAFDFSTPVGTIDPPSWTGSYSTYTGTNPVIPFVELDFKSSGGFMILIFQTDPTSFSTAASTPLDTTGLYEGGPTTISQLYCTAAPCSATGYSPFHSGTARLAPPARNVPEPGTFALASAMLGLLVLGLRRRRRERFATGESR